MLPAVQLCTPHDSASSVTLPAAWLCWQHDSAGSMTLLAAWLCWQHDSAGSTTLLAAWLCRQRDSAGSVTLLAAWLCWQHDSAGSMTLLAAWLCWQRDSADKLWKRPRWWVFRVSFVLQYSIFMFLYWTKPNSCLYLLTLPCWVNSMKKKWILSHPEFHPQNTRLWNSSFWQTASWLVFNLIREYFLPKSNFRPILGSHRSLKESQKSPNKPVTHQFLM